MTKEFEIPPVSVIDLGKIKPSLRFKVSILLAQLGPLEFQLNWYVKRHLQQDSPPENLPPIVG